MSGDEFESRLDHLRLEKLRRIGGKITARCPACAEAGGDRRGNHLAIFPSGGFACAAMSGDTEHRRRIFALVGIVGGRVRSSGDARHWVQRRALEERRERVEKREMIEEAKGRRDAIIARHEWLSPDVWHDSPQRIDCDLVGRDPRHFLASLFPAGVTLWTGEVFESGEGHAGRWRTCGEWQAVPDSRCIGPMITPSTWVPGSLSRCRENVLTAPYVVFDFDGLDGRKPQTKAELEQHVLVSLSLIRWVRESLRWKLAAVVWTGSKSLHAWFHKPSQEALATLKPVAAILGIDAGLIGNPEHPCRLPGQRHKKTGKESSVLWLQLPN